MEDTRSIPAHIVKIVVTYFTHNILTDDERDILDEWVCASDDNQIIFEAMVELVGCKEYRA